MSTSEISAPNIRVLPASAALDWIRGGLRLLARRTLALCAVVTLGPVLMWSLSLVPWIGAPIAVALAPTVSLGMLAACRLVESGQLPRFSVYTSALRDRSVRNELLRLGIAYALAMSALGLLWSFTGADDAFQTDAATGEPTLQIGGALVATAIASLVCWIPLHMAIWFAPALVAWHRMPALKAAFFSFFACWRNRWPILAFLFISAAFATFVTTVLAELIALFVPQQQAAGLLLTPLFLLLLTLVQTALFRMYGDVVQQPS